MFLTIVSTALAFTAVGLFLLNVFFPWSVVTRWRLGRLPVAPSPAAPRVLSRQDLDPALAHELAAGAAEALERSRRLFGRGPAELVWVAHTTWWAVQLGAGVGFTAWLLGQGASAALGTGVVAAGMAAVLFAVGGLVLTVAYLPGVSDASDSMQFTLSAVDDLARAQAILARLGGQVDDLASFAHPGQRHTLLWAFTPRPVYAVFRAVGVYATIDRWRALAADLQAQADALVEGSTLRRAA